MCLVLVVKSNWFHYQKINLFDLRLIIKKLQWNSLTSQLKLFFRALLHI